MTTLSRTFSYSHFIEFLDGFTVTHRKGFATRERADCYISENQQSMDRKAWRIVDYLGHREVLNLPCYHEPTKQDYIKRIKLAKISKWHANWLHYKEETYESGWYSLCVGAERTAIRDRNERIKFRKLFPLAKLNAS